jgi:hypothetical protein
VVHEQVHQAAAYARLDNCLDLVVGAVGKVRDSPASINQNLVIERVDELGQDGEGG